MKAPLLFKDRYLLSTLIVSAVVAVLIHFPEVLSLSDSFEREELFAGMEPRDVFNEIFFTFISLLLLFWINMRIFRFNTPMIRMTRAKMALSFFLTWGASSLFGQLFVWLHHQFDIPAIDAMVHHYLHPLRDLIIACIVTGSNYIFHLIVKQQRIVIENEALRTESLSLRNKHWKSMFYKTNTRFYTQECKVGCFMLTKCRREKKKEPLSLFVSIFFFGCHQNKFSLFKVYIINGIN